MKECDKSRLVSVFTGSLWEAELVNTLLENSGIESVTKDSMAVNLALPVTEVDVSVLVHENNYATAMKVVYEYETAEIRD